MKKEMNVGFEEGFECLFLFFFLIKRKGKEEKLN